MIKVLLFLRKKVIKGSSFNSAVPSHHHMHDREQASFLGPGAAPLLSATGLAHTFYPAYFQCHRVSPRVL